MVQSHPVYYPMYRDKEKFIILITGGRSSGKALPLDALVCTPKGFVRVRDLVVGSKISSVYGGEQRVTELHPIEEREYARVSFDDGTFTDCSLEHLWTVSNGRVRLTMETALIGESRMKWNIDLCSPIDSSLREECLEILKPFAKGVGKYLMTCGYDRDDVYRFRSMGWFVREMIYGCSRWLYVDTTRTSKRILKVERIGKRIGRCISVSDSCGLFITDDYTVTHNSFQTGTFIERLTFELGEANGRRVAHQILYTRYTMTSAGISVIPEFLDKVDADGTSKYFHKANNDVINKSTGAHVMFRGIKTSSGNQTAKLKSIHGITTFVVDEAEEWTSEQEFDTIMLSIRQQGLQNRIIVIMNPSDSNHFIYQRYIKDTHRIEYFDGVPVQISTHPNVLHIHTTYLDNIEHCAEQFINEVTAMKEQNPEKYAHIVMGQWADVAEGAVYKKWGIVDEFPASARNVARGLDFGYHADASACIKCGEVYTPEGVDLYLDEQFYETGMLISDLIRELKKDPTFIYADSADPRLIDELSLGGLIIYAVSKGAGSILAGIEKAKDYNNIFVTKRSYNLQNELRNYTWDKDNMGRYINQPIDAYNHACFVRDTKVLMSNGVKRCIVDIKVGDMVRTSKGARRVTAFIDQGEREVYDYIINTYNGCLKVTCTPDHKVKMSDNSWKAIDDLDKEDEFFSYSPKKVFKPTRVKSIIKRNHRTEHVYDITVERMHEFFANNILVSNCDAFRYYLLGKIMGKVIRKEMKEGNGSRKPMNFSLN